MHTRSTPSLKDQAAAMADARDRDGFPGFVVRAARQSDLDAFHGLALATGGGFTNLPPDRAFLEARLVNSERDFHAQITRPDDECYVFVTEEVATGAIVGTCLILSRIGGAWPFYSFKLSALQQRSSAFGRACTLQHLMLNTDYDGCSEVGGLFVSPAARGSGIGRLVARSRYMFMATHRARFGERVISELRGMRDENGNSPFWDALGRHFFGVDYDEADQFGALRGNQFIIDLMPPGPFYLSLLTDAARQAIGQPHKDGRAAYAMLVDEGFAYRDYVDIFDAGPTLESQVGSLRTVRSCVSQAARIDEQLPADRMLVSSGNGPTFRVVESLARVEDNGIVINQATASVLQVEAGDLISASPV